MKRYEDCFKFSFRISSCTPYLLKIYQEGSEKRITERNHSWSIPFLYSKKVFLVWIRVIFWIYCVRNAHRSISWLSYVRHQAKYGTCLHRSWCFEFDADFYHHSPSTFMLLIQNYVKVLKLHIFTNVKPLIFQVFQI